MRLTIRAFIAFACIVWIIPTGWAQRKEFERPARHAIRGTHGAIATGSDAAAEAGMRMYYKGGNAVDAGVAAMFSGCIVEYSHFGMGGEAPILIRTKDGKVHAIAGVGGQPFQLLTRIAQKFLHGRLNVRGLDAVKGNPKPDF